MSRLNSVLSRHKGAAKTDSATYEVLPTNLTFGVRANAERRIDTSYLRVPSLPQCSRRKRTKTQSFDDNQPQRYCTLYTTLTLLWHHLDIYSGGEPLSLDHPRPISFPIRAHQPRCILIVDETVMGRCRAENVEL